MKALARRPAGCGRTAGQAGVLRRRAALAGVVAALGLWLVPAAPPWPAAASGADAGLTVVADARYDVQPAGRRVRVSVTATATAVAPETVTRRSYFTATNLVLPPTATAVRASAGKTSLAVSVVRRTRSGLVVRVAFDRHVYNAEQYPFEMRFDLVDRGGSPNREIRVGSALAAFPLWAIGTEDAAGGTVAAVFPAGYAVRVAAGALSAPRAGPGGTVTVRSARIAQPLRFSAYVVGERAGAFAESTMDLSVGGRPARIVVRSWRDDPAWAKQVGGIVRRAYPALALAIGLGPHPGGPLIVEEAVSRAIDGASARYFPAEGRLLVAYNAPPWAIVRELPHAWLNGSLVAERWMADVFAEFYARRVAVDLNVAVPALPRLSGALEAARVPLRSAVTPADSDSIDATRSRATLAAGQAFARGVQERVGDEGLWYAWRGAAAQANAAGTAGDASTPTAGPADWRGILDLLEEGAGVSLVDLWRRWVVTAPDEALLSARAATRARIGDVAARAAPWRLPEEIGEASSAWEFATADALLGRAEMVLRRRDEIAEAAGAAGLVPAGSVRAAFESGAFDEADQAASAELAAIASIAGANQARAGATDLFSELGLVGSDASARLAAAVEAQGQGEPARAVLLADEARTTWAQAHDEGFRRALQGGGAVLAVLAGIVLVLSIRRRRRRGWLADGRSNLFGL